MESTWDRSKNKMARGPRASQKPYPHRLVRRANVAAGSMVRTHIAWLL